MGEFLIVADPLQKADALVVLAGDEEERIPSGAALFKQGTADWFMLTDMRLNIPNSQGVYSANVERKAVAQGVPAGRILIVPGQVSTTAEEAARVKAFTLSHGFRSLIVVTSPYHTRRARWIMRQAFRGTGVTLIMRPAPDYPYPAATWWRIPLDRQLTFLEYAKMVANLLGCQEYSNCGLLPGSWLQAVQKDILPEK